MHFSDIIQINELRVFLTENTISLWVEEKKRKYTPRGRQVSLRPPLLHTNYLACTMDRATQVALPSMT
jgi:hypothetical protein